MVGKRATLRAGIRVPRVDLFRSVLELPPPGNRRIQLRNRSEQVRKQSEGNKFFLSGCIEFGTILPSLGNSSRFGSSTDSVNMFFWIATISGRRSEA